MKLEEKMITPTTEIVLEIFSKLGYNTQASIAKAILEQELYANKTLENFASFSAYFNQVLLENRSMSNDLANALIKLSENNKTIKKFCEERKKRIRRKTNRSAYDRTLNSALEASLSELQDKLMKAERTKWLEVLQELEKIKRNI